MFGNLRTVTQEGNTKTRQITNFFHLGFEQNKHTH